MRSDPFGPQSTWTVCGSRYHTKTKNSQGQEFLNRGLQMAHLKSTHCFGRGLWSATQNPCWAAVTPHTPAHTCTKAHEGSWRCRRYKCQKCAELIGSPQPSIRSPASLCPRPAICLIRRGWDSESVTASDLVSETVTCLQRVTTLWPE